MFQPFSSSLRNSASFGGADGSVDVTSCLWGIRRATPSGDDLENGGEPGVFGDVACHGSTLDPGARLSNRVVDLRALRHTDVPDKPHLVGDSFQEHVHRLVAEPEVPHSSTSPFPARSCSWLCSPVQLPALSAAFILFKLPHSFGNPSSSWTSGRRQAQAHGSILETETTLA